jgi:hypothetical protein
MYGAVSLRGTAGALGSVRCGVDGVGSARQAFTSASAFNQNIGSWNTARVMYITQACDLVLSHACGARSKFLSAAVVPAQVVPAQMWGWPTSDVGKSRRRCG